MHIILRSYQQTVLLVKSKLALCALVLSFVVFLFASRGDAQALAQPYDMLDRDLSTFINQLYQVDYGTAYWDNGLKANAPAGVGWADQQKFRRLAVRDTNQFPWSFVGALEIAHDTRSYGTCTGTLVSRHVVVTAAHCLYTEKHGYLEKATFHPARNIDFEGYGKYESEQIVFISPIEGKLDNNFDLAFVVLKNSPYSKQLWQQIQRVPISQVADVHFDADGTPLALLAAGYPSGNKQLWVSGSVHYRNSKALGKTNQFEHKAFSPQGTSGGPIFAFDPIYNQFAMVGIISSQRVWNDGNTWAVGVKFNEYSKQRIQQAVGRFEKDARG